MYIEGESAQAIRRSSEILIEYMEIDLTKVGRILKLEGKTAYRQFLISC